MIKEYKKYPCGCAILYRDQQVEVIPESYWIEYCPTHKAAPELLEALQGCVNVIKKWVPKRILTRYSIIPLENAKQALAKAGGKE